MRGFEVSEENFEDLLTYDDILLDYFNAFLSLPIFSKPLYYNRLTGTFLELTDESEDNDNLPTSADGSRQALYGATDAERERMIQWAKDERLPMFFRTKLFREYKLCRLLLRALDDRRVGSHHSRSAGAAAAATRSASLRGYSRQTESSASSLSNSADNSATKDADDDVESGAGGGVGGGPEDSNSGIWGVGDMPRRSALFPYQRPGSHAFSLPINMGVRTASKSASFDTTTSARHATLTTTTTTTMTTNTKLHRFRPGTYTVHGDNSSGTVSNDIENVATTSSETTDSAPVVPPLDVFTSSYGSSSHDGSSSQNGKFKLLKHSANHRCLSGNRNIQLSRDSTESSDCVQPTTTLCFTAAATAAAAAAAGGGGYDVVYEDDYDFDEDPAAHDDGMLPFTEDGMTDMQAEEGVRTLEGKHKISLQAMKELLLGSVTGMNDFRKFLQSTVGRYLYDFWLDCEFYKDTVEDFDDDHNRLLRTRLFREIQDKYKLSLARDAVQQFMYAANNFGLSQSIFVHTQYNVLRRLRVYWVPRYLLHKERINELRSGLIAGVYRRNSINSVSLTDSIPSGMFPSLSIADQHPDGEDRWRGGRSVVDGPGCGRVPTSTSLCVKTSKHSSNVNRCKSLRDRFISALMAEKSGGGPFLLFLQRCDESELLCNLLFWQDVTDFEQLSSKKIDAQVRTLQAWDIYNKFLSKDTLFNIGLSDEDRDAVHRQLISGPEFINAEIFHKLKERSVDLMQEAWIGYLKQDLKTYLDCQVRSQHSPQETNFVDNIQVTFDVETQQLIVQVVEPSSDSEQCVKRFPVMDEETRQRERQKRLERRKIMERERRRAIRAAYKRLKDAKSKAHTADSKAETNADDDDGFDLIGKPTFQTALANKSLLESFTKHLVDTNNKELVNVVSLFTEIETYHNISGGPLQQKKKEEQAALINRMFLLPTAKKKVNFGSNVSIQMHNNKDRPVTPLLKELQSAVQQAIEASFERYCNTEEFTVELRKLVATARLQASQDPRKSRANKDGRTAVGLLPSIDKPSFLNQQRTNTNIPFNPFGQTATSAGEIAVKLTSSSRQSGSTDAVDGEYSVDQADGHHRHGKKMLPIPSRIHPTKADKSEFQLALQQAAAGHLPIHMWMFYEFLVQYGEQENNPRLDKDLFFYCEVLKFKEASHAFADEELLKRKVQSVTESYVESAASTSPNTMHIDVNSDVQQKILKAAQKYVAGKDQTPTLFDEAQASVFKEMLPYWVAFIRNYSPPKDNRPIPMTRLMRERRKKFEEILCWKPPAANNIILPMLSKGSIAATSFSYSISDGFKWKDAGGLTDDRSSQGRRLSVLEDVDDIPASASGASRPKKLSIASRVSSATNANTIPTEA